MPLDRDEFLGLNRTTTVKVGEWCNDPEAEVLIGTMGVLDRRSLDEEQKAAGWEVGGLDWSIAFCLRVILNPVTNGRMFGDSDRSALNKAPGLVMAITDAGLKLDAGPKKNDSSGGPSPGDSESPTPTCSQEV